MKQRFTTFIVIFFVLANPFGGFTQANNTVVTNDSLTIENQFEHLFTRSNRFEDYKVMKMSSYNTLKKNTLDSIRMYTVQVGQLKNEILNLNAKIDTQAVNITSLSTELENTKNIQDSMSFLGLFYVSKASYNSIMWGLVICLLALSSILFSMFKRGHSVVKLTKKQLEEVQSDLENQRKNALVREQKLARELMDVKLKHKSNH
ncbi:MAG: hypothetical protein ACK5JD_07320 [Mangrovibacterium sp.]